MPRATMLLFSLAHDSKFRRPVLISFLDVKTAKPVLQVRCPDIENRHEYSVVHEKIYVCARLVLSDALLRL